MKIKILSTIGFIYGVFHFFSCSKDLGNYEYSTLDSLTISAIEDRYTAYTGKEFQITPEFDYSGARAVDSNTFAFEWFVINAATTLNSDKRTTLSKSPNLALNLPLAAGSYTLYLRVQERETGEFWEKKTSLNVTSEIADGWLILNDIKGESRLDMLNYNSSSLSFERYTNLLASTSDMQLNGKPKFVYYVYNRDFLTSAFTNRIYIGTDQNTYSINNQARLWSNYRNLKTEVMRPTGMNYHAEAIYGQGRQGLVYLLDNEGVLMLENITASMLYGPTFNRLNNSGRLNISPYVATLDGNSSPYAVLYDTTNKRFLVHNGNNKVCFVPGSSDAALVNPANMGQNLLFMEYVLTSTKQFYALLQQPETKKLKMYRFVASSATFTPLAYDDVANTHRMDEADFYTTDPVYGFVIYSVGSKVYLYDPFNKVYKTVLDVGNRTISLLKYQRLLNNKSSSRYISYANQLMLCTYDPSEPDKSGKMEFYEIDLQGNASLSTSFDGFGKIVSVTYRE